MIFAFLFKTNLFEAYIYLHYDLDLAELNSLQVCSLIPDL